VDSENYNEMKPGIPRTVVALFDGPPIRATLARGAIRNRIDAVRSMRQETDEAFDKFVKNFPWKVKE